jgi:chemotaxis signal transduction protein
VEQSAGRTEEVVVFNLGSRTHAVGLQYLTEVLPLPSCSRVPGTPLHFSGAINVRGEFRAVLDLARFLGLPEDPNGNAGFVLMLRHQNQRIAWKVDGVEGIREIALAEVAPASEGKYVKGLASGTLLLVDADKILTDVFEMKES